MKKESIICVLNTIKSICDSYCKCSGCVFEKMCPYTMRHMTDEDNIERVADVIKNTMDKELKDNEEERYL